MNCPHCGKRITQKAIAKELGSKGGKITGPTKARTSEQARAASLARWNKPKTPKKPKP